MEGLVLAINLTDFYPPKKKLYNPTDTSTGPFGGAHGKDYVCVQSIDGTLNLFEAESFSFSRFLPGFLIPGTVYIY